MRCLRRHPLVVVPTVTLLFVGCGDADRATDRAVPSAETERAARGQGVLTTPPVVLAAGWLRSGLRFELVGRRLSSRGKASLCIDVTLPDRHEAYGCANNRGRAQGQFVSWGRVDLTLVNGATSPAARRVVVHYEVDGVPGSREAVLVQVDDPDVIRRIRVDGPFGFYVAELPEGARDIVAEAFDAGGRSMWRAVFYDYSRRASPDLEGRPRSRG
jgi:hypothetical protein